MSVHLPRLQTERLKRRGVRPSDNTPLVVYAKTRNAFTLTAIDEAAKKAGLHPAMPLADARAINPGLTAVEANPDKDARLLDAIAAWCERFTPIVVIDPPQGLFLDITGCAHLFGGEEALLANIRRRLRAKGFTASAAIAPTPGAAWALARYSTTTRIDKSGMERALAPLPLSALRFAPETVALLKRLGLTTIGQIIDAPRQSLTARAGAGAMRRLDQALARANEVLTPRRPPPPLFALRRLVEPIHDLDGVLYVADILCTDICNDLEKRGAGALAFRLLLFGVNRNAKIINLAVSRLENNPQILLRLFRERLRVAPETLNAEFGIEAIRLDVIEIAPIKAQSVTLDASRDNANPEETSRLLDRLKARLGGDRVGMLTIQGRHKPEAASAFAMPDVANSLTISPAMDGVMRRPLHVFTPAQPIETIALMPDGPPARFRWRRILHEIHRAEGPERIEGDWLNQTSERVRDYYRIEDKKGRRFWVYREGLYSENEPPRWFLHGLFS